MEKACEKADTTPKALARYGVLRADTDQMLRRFVEGRPVSAVTIKFLQWIVTRLARESKRVFVLVWANASWHISQKVRQWICAHNRHVKRAGGVRILTCRLPIKSPWLNPIEPKWLHGKRAIVEPVRTLSAPELITRICDYFDCKHLTHLKQKAS
jgi:hypothetical protein